MANSLRPFSLGWHPVEPRRGPRSPLLDDPPPVTAGGGAGGYAAVHHQWRMQVEADAHRLMQAQQAQPLWYPVPLDDAVHVVPIYGGTLRGIEQVATTMVLSALESGTTTCRVVNLTGWDLAGELKAQLAPARRQKGRFETIGPRGSTADLFGNPDRSELLALLADALRVSANCNGARQSQLYRQELEEIVKFLVGPVNLHRIKAALDLALGSGLPDPSLSIHEVRDLQDYFSRVVSQRRSTQERITDLNLDLSALGAFARMPAVKGAVLGSGPRVSVRWYDLAPTFMAADAELGRELLTRAVLQTYGAQHKGAAGTADELLVVIGAEKLADEVLAGMQRVAQGQHKRLVLMYTEFSDAGKRALGYAGSSLAVFLTMPNHDDAIVAAEHLGREFKFVVNGITITEGETEEWSESYGTSSSRGTAIGRNSGRSSGFQGGAFNFGRTVGSSVTKSFDQGTNHAVVSGGGNSKQKAVQQGRVHEFVMEPEEFQNMPHDAVMIVNGKQVTIASCDNALRRSRLTSKVAVVGP